MSETTAYNDVCLQCRQYPCRCGTAVDPPGVYEMMQLQTTWNCTAGQHEWLPWATLPNGDVATRCIYCRREEKWVEGVED